MANRGHPAPQGVVAHLHGETGNMHTEVETSDETASIPSNIQAEVNTDNTPMEQDEAENERKELMKRSAYINLRRNNLLGYSNGQLARMMEEENEVKPEFLYKLGQSLKLVYQSHEDRERAISEKCIMQSMVVSLEKPYAETANRQIIKTRYMYGIPIHKKEENIVKWLEGRSWKPMSEFRWLTYPNSTIRNSGRSIRVAVPPDQDVPGYVRYSCPGMKDRTIQILYPGVKEWCRHCFSRGHLVSTCPHKQKSRRDTTASTYASAVSGVQPAVGGPTPTNANVTAIEPEPTTVQNQKPPNQLEAEYGNKLTAFFNRQHFCSNHYPCRIKVDDIQYHSTEQHLFHRKAILAGDDNMAEQIMQTGTAGKVKSLSKGIVWPETLGDWHETAEQLLEQSNRCKYEQNKELREQFFATAGTRLVEATRRDQYWSCGWDVQDSETRDFRKWTGENRFGDILTHLRRKMMAEPRYKEEAEAARRKREQSNKRARTDSETTGLSPEAKKNNELFVTPEK